LADDLASTFGIPPELAFNENGETGRCNQEVVDRPCRRIQFCANGNRAGEHRVDLGDGQTGWLGMDEVLNISLTDRILTGLSIERYQRRCFPCASG
jgi:hypothetical protein